MKRRFVAALFLVALILPANVMAAVPTWNLTGAYTVEFVCVTGDCATQTFVHSMTITSSNNTTGDVAGTGFIEGQPSLDWTVTGNVSGSDVSLDIEWSVGSGLGSLNPLLLAGTIDSQGGMSGTASDAGGRTFTWQTTAGAASLIDRTPPTVTSFAPTTLLTSAASLSYTLTFGEPVTGLVSGDFTRTGTATGCAVAPSGSGTTYTVAVTGCTEGTVILALKANSVVDLANNTGPAADVTASTVTIDRTVPTTTLIAPTSPTNAASLSYTLTFGEPVTGLVSGDFTRTGTATGCAVAPSGSGTTYTVAVTGCTEGTVILALKANSVVDLANTTGPAADVTASTVTIDRTAPTTTSLRVTPRTGATLSGTSVPLGLTWYANDAGGSGVARYELARSTNHRAWTTVSTSLTTKAASVTAASSGTVRYAVRAVDRAGNAGAWTLGLTLGPRLTQQTSTSVRYSGAWASRTSSSYSGGSAKSAAVAGRSASYAFTGRSIALVMTKAPSRGKVKVYVNGVYLATVDLYRSSSLNRVLVWQRTWSTSSSRTVKLVVVGTAGRPRVDLDAFVVVK